MNNWAQRKAIAEYRGWLDIKETGRLDGQLVGFPPGGKLGERVELPDWPDDLNAVHELLNKLDPLLRNMFVNELTLPIKAFENFGWEAVNATAQRRCEAFLRTIGKWQDEVRK